MKIEGSKPGVQPEAKPGRKDRAREFGKVLGDDAANSTPGSGPPLPLPQQAPVRAEESRGPATARLIDHIGDEISARLSASPDQVTVKFDSTTLGGLEVRISKIDGQLRIQLTSASPDVTRLCENNAGALANRLADRGYPNAAVSVDRPSPSRYRERGEQGGSRQQKGGR